MSTPTPLNVSLIDVLAMISNQSRIVGAHSEALMRGHPETSPEHIVASTNRLSELTAHMIRMISANTSNTEKAA